MRRIIVFAILVMLMLPASLLFSSQYNLVAELFKWTSGCGWCTSAQVGLTELYNNHPNVIPIGLYTSGSLNTPFASQRDNFYGVGGVPHCQFGGEYSQVGGSASGSTYNQYLTVYNNYINYESPLEITMGFGISGTQAMIQAMVLQTEDITDTDLSIYYVITVHDGDGSHNYRSVIA
ncbi:MAG: hypothetical protein K8S56_05305, partial [Candidatus Cloacimonetes bacterium]|nr:hypothetical protein [Candidatus Cloacimonadota bacterium]